MLLIIFSIYTDQSRNSRITQTNGKQSDIGLFDCLKFFFNTSGKFFAVGYQYNFAGGSAGGFQ